MILGLFAFLLAIFIVYYNGFIEPTISLSLTISLISFIIATFVFYFNSLNSYYNEKENKENQKAIMEQFIKLNEKVEALQKLIDLKENTGSGEDQ